MTDEITLAQQRGLIERLSAVRVEKFLVQVTLANETEGGRMGTAWKDREKFKKWLRACAGFWAQHQTTGPEPDVQIIEEQ